MKQTDAFPTPPRTKRTTFSLPSETLERIERLSRRFGVSQSAFVAELLDEPLAAMAAIMDALPETGATPQDVKRARGRSVDFIKNVVGEALEAVADLATGPAQRRSTRAARGQDPNPGQTPAPSQGKGRRASAAAEDSGSSRGSLRSPARGSSPSRATKPPSRPRRPSGSAVKGGTQRRGTTKR